MVRPIPEYIAQTVVMVNGVRAMNPGDDVPADVVENLGLVVGTHVLPANVNVIPRPGGSAKRQDWVAYWLGQRLPQEEVDEMTRDEMAAREPEIVVSDEDVPAVFVADQPNPAPDLVAEQGNDALGANAHTVERPGSDARKADWVAYATYRGMDEATANDSTIAQLSDADYDTLYGPEQG